MSRIGGIISQNINPAQLRSMGEFMGRIMQHEDWHRVDQWIDQNGSFVHTSIEAVNREPQPIFNENKSKMIIFAGKIFAYEKRKQELIDLGHRFEFKDNDAEFVLHLYEEYGTQKLKELNGIFAFAIWDKTKNELIVANDRYGMRPLYYYFDNQRKMLLFASEIKAIARQDLVKRHINWEAWNVFLRAGFLIGEETFYKNIFTLPQAGILRFNLDRIQIEQYWHYDEIKVRSRSNEEEDIENLIFLFKQAVRRQVIPHQKVAVFLSGGLDSRGIAAELKRQCVDFVTFTTRKFGKIDKDKKLAQIVSQRLGIKNIFCDLPNDFLEVQEPYKNYLLDFETNEHAWLLPLLKEIPRDIKINYDGMGNDTVCDPYLYVDSLRPYIAIFESKQYEEFFRKCLFPKLFSYLPWEEEKDHFAVLTKSLQNKFSKETFLMKMKKEIERYHENTFIAFQMATRARRAVGLAPFQLMLNQLESFCPYLDNDYFDYLMSIPLEVKHNLTLRTKILNRAYPEIKDLANLSLSKVDQQTYTEEYIILDPQFENQKMRHLMQMSQDLMKRLNTGLYNRSYLLPRLIYAYLLGKISTLANGRTSQLLSRRNLYWLIQPFYLFDSWIQAEGMTKNDFSLN